MTFDSLLRYRLLQTHLVLYVAIEKRFYDAPWVFAEKVIQVGNMTKDDEQLSRLVDPSIHMEGFQQVREARRQELIEDYVELISDLIRDGGEARQVDIAARIGVAQPTVAKMLKRLAAAGLIVRRPYRGVFLTGDGEVLAEASRARHHVVETLLLTLGVDADTARRDAEGMEHHVSETTLAVFRSFIVSRQL